MSDSRDSSKISIKGSQNAYWATSDVIEAFLDEAIRYGAKHRRGS